MSLPSSRHRSASGSSGRSKTEFRRLAASSTIDQYQLRLYCIVQASWFCSLLLGAAVSLFTERPKSVFAVLGLSRAPMGDEEFRQKMAADILGAVDFAACQDVTLISERIGDDPRGVVGAVRPTPFKMVPSLRQTSSVA